MCVVVYEHDVVKKKLKFEGSRGQSREGHFCGSSRGVEGAVVLTNFAI